MIEDKSKLLLGVAWSVEVVAVLIGLAIAYLNATLTLTQLDNPNTISFIIAGLPFVAVALIEITKIPFAYAVYHAKKIRWKVIFILSLLLLMFVTFETMSNGFENNFHNIKQTISQEVDKIINKKDQIKDIDNKVFLIKEQHEKIEKEYKEYIKDYNNKIKVLNTENHNAEIRSISQQIEGIDSQITEAKNDLKSNTSNQENKINSEISNIRNDIKSLRSDLNKLIKKQADSFFGDSATKTEIKDLRKTIQSKESLLKNLSSRLLNSNNSNSIINNLRNKKEKLLTKYTKLQQEFVKTSRNNKESLDKDKKLKNKEYQKFLEIKKNELDDLNNLKSRKIVLQNDISKINQKINKKSTNIQIYRIALLFYGEDCSNDVIGCKKVEHASDLSKEQINFTASLWFGSIAAIIAWSGVLLAFAGIVLGSEKNQTVKKINFFRNILLLMYKFKRKVKIVEKEVVKEVPVDKIVEKDVVREVPVDKVVFKEIPKEVIRKEYVHVPIYTNDKNLLKNNE